MRKIYHGSVKIIEHPQYGAGRKDNDYGPGFYCTEDIELAKEWAASDERGGFVNCYEVEEDGMCFLKLQQEPEESILRFSAGEQMILQWMALLVDNR